jgi:hypothetical protein
MALDRLSQIGLSILPISAATVYFVAFTASQPVHCKAYSSAEMAEILGFNTRENARLAAI